MSANMVIHYDDAALIAPDNVAEALEHIAAERARQDAKWGVQRHDWTEWLCILTEEIGEAAREANQAHWAKSQDEHYEHRDKLLVELIQAAAVAAAIIEQLLDAQT